jgi:hypothetical protein
MRRRKIRQLATAAAALFATLAATPGWAGPVRVGEDRGLGLMGAETPAVLKAVAADPYKAPSAPVCESIPQEIAALNEVLGADVDTPKVKASLLGPNLIGGAVRGLVPYRGWVRMLTRAGDRDKALMNAAMAGYARRGYLRGLEQNLACGAASQPAAAVTGVIAVDTVPDAPRLESPRFEAPSLQALGPG